MARRYASCSRPVPACRSWPRRQRGFTYLGLLAVLLVLGWWLAATGQLWSTVARQQREQELLFIGDQFRQAIAQYYEQSPGGAKRFPPSMAALLRDPRLPFTRRYLRRIYPDPFTGKTEWGLIRAPDAGIAGVYSLAEGKPLKRDNFAPQYREFAQADSYADWRFAYRLVTSAAGTPEPVASQPATEAPSASAVTSTPAPPAETGNDTGELSPE
ncbi:type II secretion system protein [Vogesella facilis]|uniref:Type II secretion system protein n=1 Tax=Vogesella facilis TaxID=1655232 RepID=A0ABV7RAK4_9NEIS